MSRLIKSYKTEINPTPEQKTGYVPQAKQSVFSYQVIDAVIMGLNTQKGFFSTPKKADYEKAEEIMENLGIIRLRDKSCNKLSGGEPGSAVGEHAPLRTVHRTCYAPDISVMMFFRMFFFFPEKKL